jgi:hypothetical protein
LEGIWLLDTAAADNRHPKLRSRLTNNPCLLPGLDRRTREGRRFYDIALALGEEYPGANPVALRELATLRFTHEREQGLIVSGDRRSAEDLVRLSNAIERKERALRAAKRQAIAAPQPSLAQKLDARYPKAAS